MSGLDAVDVTVVVPCYNHGQFLREAIESAEKSRNVRFEIIVVDDGSTDKATIDVMAKLRRDGYHVIRHEENRGVSAARNTGIARARGRYILPLDADNRIRPDYLRLGTSILDRAPTAGVVYGDLEYFGDETGRVVTLEFSLERLMIQNIVDNGSMFRRVIWEECGGYDTEMPDRLGYEDWDLWLQAAKRGWGFVRIPEVMLDYRVRSDSMVRACWIPANHRRLVGYLTTKHRDFYVAHLPEILALARRSADLETTFRNMKASAFWRARGVYVRLRRLFDRSWS